MQFATDIPQLIDQRLLDVHVDIFERRCERHFTTLDGLPDTRQSLLDLGALVACQNANRRQHLCVRDGTSDVVSVKPAVKAVTFAKRLDTRIRPITEYPAP